MTIFSESIVVKSDLNIYFAIQSALKMEKDYIKDLSEIRSIMEKSSRFISLSGLSGVMAGIYALIGAFVASHLIYNSYDFLNNGFLEREVGVNLTYLVIDAVAVIILTIATGIYFTTKKAKKNNVKTWDESAKNVIINLLIPLVVGGLFVLVLYSRGFISLIAPATLIFYGLGLINASKYTFRDIRYLGFLEVALGLVASTTIGNGLLFWAIGFGVLHIIYGALMYFKYER